jgi:hypothetical protein
MFHDRCTPSVLGPAHKRKRAGIYVYQMALDGQLIRRVEGGSPHTRLRPNTGLGIRGIALVCASVDTRSKVNIFVCGLVSGAMYLRRESGPQTLAFSTLSLDLCIYIKAEGTSTAHAPI